KTIYAQSSDIKSRTYLEYRKDMKKKAIAELEVLEWLESKVKELYPKKQGVPKEKFERLLKPDPTLKNLCRKIDAKIFILNFQHDLNKIPQNANLWLIYLLSYINKDIQLEDISKIVYCIDFLYSKIELKPNELTQLSGKIEELMRMIDRFCNFHCFFRHWICFTGSSCLCVHYSDSIALPRYPFLPASSRFGYPA
ncbi:MAG: hypothetical protein ACP5LE_03070, partial [Thermoplasmata archaeon]